MDYEDKFNRVLDVARQAVINVDFGKRKIRSENEQANAAD